MIWLQMTQQLNVVRGVTRLLLLDLVCYTNTLQSVCTLEYEHGRVRSHPTTARERLWWCLQHRHYPNVRIYSSAILGVSCFTLVFFSFLRLISF